MKKEIEVSVDYKIVNRIKAEVDFPETKKYYSKNHDGLFARGLILFAVIPNFKNNPTKSYTLVQVERGKQDYNDFVPHDDCRSDYWLKETGIRKTAFGIFTTQLLNDFTEISEREFEEKRTMLLDVYKTNE